MSTEKIEKRLANVERMLKQLLEKQQPEWISEKEAMQMLGRSSSWLKNQRLGINDLAPTLYKDKDWRYINGRTPEYLRKSIEARKHFSPETIKHQ